MKLPNDIMRAIRFFPTWKSRLGEVRNQLCRIRGLYYSYKVQGIVIEPTNDCNLRCKHCTTPKGKGYMDLSLYKRLIDQDLMCVIIGKNGEPTLHPQIVDMIRYAKKLYVCIYTNGLRNCEDLVDAGVDEMQFRPGAMIDYKTRTEIHYIITEAANGEPLMGVKSALRTRPCRNLWRNLVVSWDGEVTPCCVDMYNTLSLGNASDEMLQDIFNGDKMRHIRNLHLQGEFPEVCKYCDEYFG